MSNKEKFLSLVTGRDTQTAKEIELRNANRKRLKESKRIAISVLSALREKGISQKDLAELISVTPQYVSKLIKGKQNLTLDTIIILQDALDIQILASYKKEISEVSVSEVCGSLNDTRYLMFNPKEKDESSNKLSV